MHDAVCSLQADTVSVSSLSAGPWRGPTLQRGDPTSRATLIRLDRRDAPGPAWRADEVLGVSPTRLVAPLAPGCQNGTMRRMNLRDVPEDVYAALAQAAEAHRQSLSGYVIDRLAEVVQILGVADYVDSYAPPRRTGVSLEDAVQAIRDVREAS
jgi:hypothetical protein